MELLRYDVLDRLLCRGTAANQVNPCQSSAYATYFYDGYTNSSNPNETFPITCSAPTGSSDPVGRATVETFSSSAGSGWRCYGYDARGRTTSSGLSVTADGQITTQTALMSYNDAGAVTSLTYPDGEVLSSNYDNAGYLRSLYFGDTSSSDPVSFLSGQISYTNTGQLAGLDIGGSGAKASVPTPVFSTTLGYDGIQRPITSSATLTGASTPLWNLTRTLDNVGNVLQTTATVPTTAGSSLTDTQSFCYDALSRLTWAGNSGTTLGADHCGSAPTGSTTPGYSHVYAYDAADRMISGDSGTLTYTDAAHSHAATYVSSIPNQYASYDVMGNMTCRTTDTTGGQSCAAGVQTGAQLSYDNLGRLASWTGANGLQSSEQYLYDNEGNRVLRHDSTTSGTTTTTDTITFDGLTDVSMVNGAAPTITNYYSVAGQRVAMRKGAILSYLLPDFLGSDSIALNSDGTVQAVQLFAPYGAVRYSDQVMPTDYNFTGQRLDSQTGLLYYNARYYDSVSGRFTSPDTVANNTRGRDPFAYVGDNPETKSDPTGHDACDAACISTVVGTAGAAGIELGPGDIGVMGLALVGILAWNAYNSSQQPSPISTPANTSAATSIGIDIGIANKPGAWNPSESDTVAGKVSVWGESQREAAIAATGGVALDEKVDPAKANVAAAFLSITDTSGTTTTYENFALGFKGANDPDHAEAQLIVWAILTIGGQQASRALTNVNLLIWSGKTPCKQYCNPLLYSHTWLKTLWQAMGTLPGAGWANLDFYAGGIPGVPFAQRYSYSYNGLNVVQRNRIKDL